jgi:phenylalanyl-tRNA synthetase beta chain
MDISYNWVCELAGGTLPPPHELARRLTMIGLAVDSVRQAGEDYVLEFDLTSNRPDCLSHLGIAREAAAMLRNPLSFLDPSTHKTSGRAETLTSVDILDPDLCPRYTARIIRGVTIGPSPDWLVRRLETIGQRAINNVADITNYVMHEYGQPLHAFDFATLIEQRIIVRRARHGERIRTLDGVDRALDEQMLIIADGARAVGVAGVMGGEETEISATTRDVLIESAHFNPSSVRRTARALGLTTEASYRFERGVDYGGVLRAQEACVDLIVSIAGGVATENAVDAYPAPIEPPVVQIRKERVTALTGLEVPRHQVREILTLLGFREHVESNGVPGANERVEAPMSFVAPTWRFDIEIEEDLVEEVARLNGYEKIPQELPPSPVAGEYQPGEIRKRELRRALTGLGFDEAISFSFIDSANAGVFEPLPELATIDAGTSVVALSNPVIDNVTLMRPTLLPGLLDAVRRNFHHGTRTVRLFEIGRIFGPNAEPSKLPVEREALALVVTGVEDTTSRELDFYDLKGVIESASDAINLRPVNLKAGPAKHLRAGQSATLTLGDQAIGTIGRLDEAIAEIYKFKQPVYVAELDLQAMLEFPAPASLYRSLPRYPSIVRDISLLLDRGVSFDEIIAAIIGLGMEYCRDISLLDVYEGANIPNEKRSITLRIEYRADDRTLRDDIVDEMHARVVAVLEEKFKAQLRA